MTKQAVRLPASRRTRDRQEKEDETIRTNEDSITFLSFAWIVFFLFHDKQVQRVVEVVDDGSLVGGWCTRTREVDEGVDRKRRRERVIPHVSEYEMTTSASAANSTLLVVVGQRKREKHVSIPGSEDHVGHLMTGREENRW